MTQDTNTASGAADKALAYLDDLSDDAAAHIFPSDLAKCMTSECVVKVCSVRAGNPNEKTVPLFSREQVVAALASATPQADSEPAPNACDGKDPRGCWNVRCQLGKRCINSDRAARSTADRQSVPEHNIVSLSPLPTPAHNERVYGGHGNEIVHSYYTEHQMLGYARQEVYRAEEAWQARASHGQAPAGAGESAYDPCGGCGEDDPKKRCLGCMHPFTPTTQQAPSVLEDAALPKITAEDRSFLHDNPNTDDVVKWVQDYARTCIEAERASRGQAPAGAEIERLRALAATCYAGLGAECNLPDNWLDVLNAAANGEPFDTDGLLPFTAQPAEQPNTAYAELPEPDSYLFQHDETGLTQHVDAQQVEWGFERNNPRLRRVSGTFTEPQMRAFADATHALRASRGQAPVGAVPEVLDKATKHSHLKYTLTTSRAAFQAGALFALNTMRDQPAPADSVLEDAARLDFLIEQRAYVVSDPDACPGYWLHFIHKETGKCWVQCDEHPTPRAAIDAARKQGANHD